MNSRMESSENKLNPNAELYRVACEVLPGGVSRNTIYRKPHPFYAREASGCYVTDIEGVRRVDFANNMASLIHGHAHPAIVEAVTKQLKRGTGFTMATEAEVVYAEYMCHRVPSFEKIRFVNSGTEAVMTLIKAARAYTDRPKLAKFEGAYHGTYDYAEVSQTSHPGNWGEEGNPNSIPVARGTPQGVLNDVVVLPFNDTEKAISILDRHSDQIACVLLDLMPHRVGMIPIAEDFLTALYKWTRKNGAVLAFDEVITFRTRYFGAQEKYGIQPDLTALAKIIGGGFPCGAIAGKKEIMKVLDPSEKELLFPHSGTFSANPVTMTAGKIAMELFDEAAVVRINKLAKRAQIQITEAAKLAGVGACVTGEGSLFRIHLKQKPPENYRQAWMDAKTVNGIRLLLEHLYEEGFMLINTCTAALSTAISEKEIDELSEAFLSGFKKIKPAIEQAIA